VWATAFLLEQPQLRMQYVGNCVVSALLCVQFVEATPALPHRSANNPMLRATCGRILRFKCRP